MVTFAREEHPEKALRPILSAESGISNAVSEVQEAKAWLPISFKLFGKSSDASAEQPINESYSIADTVSGICMKVRALQ